MQINGTKAKLILIFVIFIVGTVSFVYRIGNNNDLLKLKASEVKVYEEYSNNEDEKILDNLEPMDIFKLYLYSLEKKDFLTTYRFYDNSHSCQIPSKQQYLMMAFRRCDDKENLVLDKIKDHTKNIKELKISENKWVIEIKYDDTDYISRFFFVKRDDSTWKLKWRKNILRQNVSICGRYCG